MSAPITPIPSPLPVDAIFDIVDEVAEALRVRHDDLGERLDRLKAAAAHHDEEARRACDAWQAARGKEDNPRPGVEAYWKMERACAMKVAALAGCWGYVWHAARRLGEDARSTKAALVAALTPAPAGVAALHVEAVGIALDLLDEAERTAAEVAPIALNEWRRNRDLQEAATADKQRVHTAIDKAWRQWLDPRGRSGIAPLPMPEEIAVYAARWAIHRYGGETAPKKAGFEAQRMVKEWRAMRGDRPCLWDVGRAGSLASGLVRPGEQERHANLLHALFVRATKCGDW